MKTKDNIKLIKFCIILVTTLYLIPEIHTSDNTIPVASPSKPIQTVLPVKAITITNTNISYNMSLLTKSNVTAKQLDKAFGKTKMKGLGKYFVKAERETGVNAIYLAGLGCLESAWGTSGYATKRNNLFGWQAYDKNPDLAKDFATKEEAIMTVARALSNNYLSEDGCCYNGYTMKSISIKYASDPNHSTKIYSIMKILVNRMEVE